MSTNKIIYAVLIDPDYEEEVHDQPYTSEEVKNLFARGYTLSVQGLGTFEMDFCPKATVIFKPRGNLETELRKIYSNI